MPNTKVYIVCGCYEEVDSNDHWNVKAFSDEKRAENFAFKCQQEHDAHVEKYRGKLNLDKITNLLVGDGIVELDPSAGNFAWMHDIVYRVEALDLE